MSHYQTQKVTPQNGHVEPGSWRLSHGKSEYKSRSCPEDACSGTTANSRPCRQFLAILPIQIVVYRISSASTFPENFFAPCSPANFGEECSKEIKDMKTTTKKMKTKTIALSLGLILVAGGLYAADPFEGTWKLNESKSKITRRYRQGYEDRL